MAAGAWGETLSIAVVLTARPSYAKLKPVIAALLARQVDVRVIACASALLERYGRVADVARADFPEVAIDECWSTYEGATLHTSALETGALTQQVATAVSRLRPDAVVVCADRHEVLGAAQAVAYLHIPLIHLQGGEHSGSIDDRVRDAITQLANVHCVCTTQARLRVYALTGDYEAIHVTGCPSIDVAKHAQHGPPVTVEELGGSGALIDLAQPFVVVLQHPVTSEADHAGAQMEMVLGCQRSSRQLLVLWPGEDAGAEAMSKVIRACQPWVHTVRNLPPVRFLRLLTQASCLVGNSSAGIREASYLGVPVVNVGSRQHGRERGPNVIDVGFNGSDILRAVDRQIAHGRYPSSRLYGDGTAGERTADVIGERVGADSRAQRV